MVARPPRGRRPGLPGPGRRPGGGQRPLHEGALSLHPTFADEGLERELEARGYVVLPGLERARLAGIREEFLRLAPADGFRGRQQTALRCQDFHLTFFDSDLRYRRAVFSRIRELFDPFVAHHLPGHRMAQGNVFLKPPGKGFVYPHQNLTITDETRFRSVSLWCPLQPTGERNGTLMVIPGSHVGLMRYRNTLLEVPAFRALMPGGPATRHLVPLDVDGGEVVVLDDRLLHVSPDNLSDEPRWVLHSLWLPEAAPLRYFDVQGGRVSEFAVPEHFWQDYSPGTRPQGLELVETRPAAEPRLDEIALLRRLEDLSRKWGVAGAGRGRQAP